jgi:hypothetical protein
VVFEGERWVSKKKDLVGHFEGWEGEKGGEDGESTSELKTR